MRLLLIAVILFCSNLGKANSNISLLGSFAYNQEISDVWGYTDEFGNEYALVGAQKGFSIVDVTTPSNPVEVFYQSGYKSTWRDIKVYNDHAYITNETNGGLLIVDMSPLPQNTTLQVDSFFGTTHMFSRAHNIWIDENGVAYIFGANNGKGGAIMFDLTQNPKVPVEIGFIDNFYLHDGFVRGDTLWGSAVYEGLQIIMDVSDKVNPQILTTFETPGTFSHNCWPSDNGKYVFTTDEIAGGYIGSFDVSDFSDPKEVDKFRIASLKNPIPHNTFVLDNLLITSYYSEGLHILDATYPQSLIEVGKYDSSPLFEDDFHGAWGVYPYFDSGKILIADIEEGLFIFQPNIQTPAYLQGEVRDTITNNPIINCEVVVFGSRTFKTQEFGNYYTGAKNSGLYSVRFQKQGYISKTINNIQLNQGSIKTLDTYLIPEGASLGNEELGTKSEDFRIYPNPFSNQINTNSSEKISLKLFNMQGELVGEGINHIETSNTLAQAPYLIKAFKKGELISKQLIFKK